MKKEILMTAVATMMAHGVNASTSDNAAAADKAQPKYLVIYYSQGGTTKAVADEIQKCLNADIEAIEAVTPYDGTYQQTVERGRQEREAGIVPAVKPLKADLSAYDAVFLGYPIWFGTYALPVVGFVNSTDFAGKTVVPFATFGSGGLESSMADLKKAQPNAKIAPGYGVRTSRIEAMPRELNRFLIENGYMTGTVTPLPDYSAQSAVTEDDIKIFNEACSGYKFPLGTPLTVARRTTDDGLDLKYIVKSQMPGGENATATIYVLVAPDAKPVFTRVVR